eukprot:COSAG02_NODE_16590_length_1072_cov_1.389517_2_plen_55_part_01
MTWFIAAVELFVRFQRSPSVKPNTNQRADSVHIDPDRNMQSSAHTTLPWYRNVTI